MSFLDGTLDWKLHFSKYVHDQIAYWNDSCKMHFHWIMVPQNMTILNVTDFFLFKNVIKKLQD